MSRRNNPTTPTPYEETIEKIDNTLTPESPKVISKQATLHDVPLATLYGAKNNLKKINSFRNLRQSYKIDNQKSVFINDMSLMLKHVNVAENELNLQLLIEVCTIANEFFIYGNRENREISKIDSIHELMLPYFRDDIVLLTTMFDSIKHKIVKSNFIKRLYRRMKNLFFLNKTTLLMEFMKSLLSDLVSKLIMKRMLILLPILLL
jgi:hypothetical protein